MKRLKIAMLCIVIPLLMCCAQSSSVDYPKEEIYPCNCIMDTLKGEWNWVKTYGGVRGNTTDNEFKSILKILNHNEDFSVNYEVFVDNTLLYKGDFQIREDQWNRKTANVNLPHEIYGVDIVWHVYLFDILVMEYDEINGRFEHKPSKDTLTLWDGADDGYYYIYKKIKLEE